MRDKTQLHPLLQHKLKVFLKRAEDKGYKVGIGECFRTVKEQNALYAKGRTTGGSIVTNAKGSTYSSQHQWGIAFDIYRNDGKGAYNESGDWFRKVAKIAKGCGLGWGGDWKSIVDKPHYYLKKWGSTTTELKRQYKNITNFKKTWTAKATYQTGTRIRKSKLPKSKVLTIIPQGMTCDVLAKTGKYTKVKFKDVTGYAKSKYLT